MKNIIYLILGIFTLSIMISCNEDKFLEEEVFDFYAPENSFTTPGQIDMSLVKLYEDVHNLFIAGVVPTFTMFYTTDVAYDAISTTHQLNSWADNINPQAADIVFWWDNLYKIIANSNAVLSRIDAVEYPNEKAKRAKIAEAKFFRAYSKI